MPLWVPYRRFFVSRRQKHQISGLHQFLCVQNFFHVSLSSICNVFFFQLFAITVCKALKLFPMYHCLYGTPRVPSDLFTNTTTCDLFSNKYSLEVFAYSFCPSYPDMKSLIKVLYDGFSQTDVRQKLFLC